jgi:hypothetical protein
MTEPVTLTILFGFMGFLFLFRNSILEAINKNKSKQNSKQWEKHQ